MTKPISLTPLITRLSSLLCWSFYVLYEPAQLIIEELDSTQQLAVESSWSRYPLQTSTIHRDIKASTGSDSGNYTLTAVSKYGQNSSKVDVDALTSKIIGHSYISQFESKWNSRKARMRVGTENRNL